MTLRKFYMKSSFVSLKNLFVYIGAPRSRELSPKIIFPDFFFFLKHGPSPTLTLNKMKTSKAFNANPFSISFPAAFS